jgi:O-antigen/teichoic acid export membrane protein
MKPGLFWSIIMVVVGTLSTLTITPTLIRTLGAAEFGLYVLVISVASYAGLFDFGLTWAATRYFAQDLAAGDGSRLAGRLRTLELFLLSVACASLCAALAAGPWVMRAAGAPRDKNLALALSLGAVSFGLSLEAQLHASLLRAAQRFEQAGRTAAIGTFLLPIGSYTAIRTAPGLDSLLFVNVCVNAIVLAFYIRASGACLASASAGCRPRLSFLREMAAFGGWSSVSKIVMIVMLQADRLAVALSGRAAGLTYYAVPSNLASRINIAGGPAANLFFARASALFASGDREGLVRQHARAVRFLVWTALALSLPVIAIGPDFLRVWIGPEMASRGGPVLIAFASGYTLASIASVDAVTIEAMGAAHVTAKNMLCWAVPAVLLAVAGAGRYGATAIAAAIAAWLALVGATNMILCRRIAAVGRRLPGVGIVVTPALVLPFGMILRPLVAGALDGLLAMCGVGGAAAGAGFFAVLSSEDRGLCAGVVLRPFRTVARRAAERAGFRAAPPLEEAYSAAIAKRVPAEGAKQVRPRRWVEGECRGGVCQ